MSENTEDISDHRAEMFVALARRANEQGNLAALIDDAGEVTWRDMLGQVDRLCLGLVHQGMRRSRGVALLVGRSRYQALALLAILRGGSVAVPLPGSLGADSLRHILKVSDPKILIYDEKHRALAEELLREFEFRAVVAIGEGIGAKNEIPWEFLAGTDVEGARYPAMNESAPALHAWGLDMAGHLRAGVLSFKNLWQGAITANRGLKVQDGTRVMTVYPAGFLLQEAVLRPLAVGGAAVFPKSIRPADVAAFSKRHHVRLLLAPACYYHAACDAAESAGISLAGVHVLEARGRVPRSLRDRVRQMFGEELLATWGIPETAGPCIGAVPGGFGTPAAPMQGYRGVRINIVDRFESEIADMAIGELLLQGDSVAETYLASDEGKQSDLNAAGWLCSGVIARRHTSGEIDILGGHFDVIYRERERVVPRVAALMLEKSETVREVEPFIVDTTDAGLRFVLAVQAEPGAETSAAQLFGFLSDRIQHPHRPDEIVIVKHFPRLPDGSVDRVRLEKEVTSLAG